MTARAAAALGALLVAAGCTDDHLPRRQPAFAAAGPPNVLRVALPGLRWPIDPAFVESRDDAVLARALFATPLRTDPQTGALRPGLCSSWRMRGGGLEWRLTCRRARAVAAAVERMRRLPSAPLGYLFAPVERVRARGTAVEVRLRFRWRRFPYVLTVPAAAPRGVRGPFRLVSARPARVVVRRRGVTVVFRRLGARAAVAAFRRRHVDEAPIPLGELRRLRRDAQLGPLVHLRPLLALDLLAFQLQYGSLARLPNTRRIYWQTAARGDYQALVPERFAGAATSILPGGSGPPAHELQRARKAVATLPPATVRILTATDEEAVYGANVLFGQWREVGLGPRLVPQRRFASALAAGRFDASFRRVVPPYPRREALAAALLLPRDGRNPWLARDSQARSLLTQALASGEETDVARLDELLQRDAAVVPVAWVAAARLVSPRVTGWRQDLLGEVDYVRVRVD